MKTRNKFLIAGDIFAPLTACGGGSDSSDTMLISDNVIDGYIVGATVFLDLNFNGVLDDDEPNEV